MNIFYIYFVVNVVHHITTLLIKCILCYLIAVYRFSCFECNLVFSSLWCLCAQK